ncbi:hypothetical protein BBBOND_0205500 [Babesia bigemina]|uniref:Uncharacterized protein n=1 Tax=Babesia bigemina TaxID=5866 RepID=A0A061D5V1_BABBI|nr:hypothetical protein BBBOND_0205500 [Babesia bigemina]CDR95392.1 hypothetical protein BBBOND_0205500 [Babesia bigemina]|eukprot:XP_012767578.1 hypothetical protein BBBOND_0205500 [Babesia bigemina]
MSIINNHGTLNLPRIQTAIALVIAVYCSSKMSQSELCSDWSHWADVSSVKNDFAIAYEDMQSASDVVVEVNDCTLLNLDPMSGKYPQRSDKERRKLT